MTSVFRKDIQTLPTPLGNPVRPQKSVTPVFMLLLGSGAAIRLTDFGIQRSLRSLTLVTGSPTLPETLVSA